VHVTVRVYSVLREVFGASSASIRIEEHATLADLIAELSMNYGEAFKEKTGRILTDALSTRFNLFLNGKKVELPRDWRLQLGDEDELVILQPVGGG